MTFRKEVAVPLQGFFFVLLLAIAILLLLGLTLLPSPYGVLFLFSKNVRWSIERIAATKLPSPYGGSFFCSRGKSGELISLWSEVRYRPLTGVLFLFSVGHITLEIEYWRELPSSYGVLFLFS